MTVLKLLLVRHGQSVGNTEGRMEGCSSSGLTPLGAQQSLRLGQHLASTGWEPTHIYCSPLERAIATLAETLRGLGYKDPESARNSMTVTLASGQTIPVTLLDGLKEYDVGIFTGLTWAEACDRHPALCHQLETSLDWQPIPQAETLEQGHNRAQRVIDELIERHRNGDRLLVIGHHWILQHAIACLMGCDRAWGLPMANTAVFEFWLDRDRWPQFGPNRLNSELWRIKRFNDTTHLQS
ncbi:histidine phosphatase family protein [Leptolyngbya sp. CCNP1308]|uniref:histidine phosphatase family protein n=1 Tax=Leptolyngbya sp. CCNP1308 TaxID=3110255 RepID=UPI002B1EFDF1|nr:histidine phosphatase family protein [Leptolyngbya sp. CCNP1308]MEA5449804.1 histidine phosphatase family protein [Leptolyngbya sp. CCNP1308]